MDKQTQIWNEHQHLQDEIRAADSLNYQILGIVVGAVAAILTAGFSKVDSGLRFFIFLCVYVVTIPGYRLLQGNRRRIWRINTYIRTFIEPEFEYIKWLTRLDRQRKGVDNTSSTRLLSSLVSTNEWLIITMMNLIAGAVAILVGLRQINLATVWRIGGIVIIVLFNLWIILTTSRQEKDLRRLGKLEQDFLRSWAKVRADESISLKEKEAE